MKVIDVVIEPVNNPPQHPAVLFMDGTSQNALIAFDPSCHVDAKWNCAAAVGEAEAIKAGKGESS